VVSAVRDYCGYSITEIMARSITPFLWTLFGAGGMVSALLFPVHIFLIGLAFPLGWLDSPDYDFLHDLVIHPITRLYLMALISLPLFHWAHRFRYTVYDVFQMTRGRNILAVICYGAALFGTMVAGYTLLTI
jgi:fumarate reductase subunit D